MFIRTHQGMTIHLTRRIIKDEFRQNFLKTMVPWGDSYDGETWGGLILFMKGPRISSGTGNTIVEFFSALKFESEEAPSGT